MSLTIDRLDSRYDWIVATPPANELRIVPFGDGCSDRTPFDVDGGAALIVRQTADCSFTELIRCFICDFSIALRYSQRYVRYSSVRMQQV